MTSFFSKDSFLQLNSLKRSPRTRKQTSPTSTKQHRCHGAGLACPPPPPTHKGRRTLHVIPELYEEPLEDSHHSRFDSQPSARTLYPTTRHPITPPIKSPSSSTLSRNSSNMSVVDLDLEERGEVRLSAYEFSIDDTLLLPPGRDAPSPPTSTSTSTSTPSAASAPQRPHPRVKSPTGRTELPITPVAPPYINAPASSHDSESDSFRLTLSDVCLNFPHPPLQSHSQPKEHAQSPSSYSSPPPSMTNSNNSSPSSHNSDLPTTPTSSDEFFPTIRAHSPTHAKKQTRRRASVKPLVIVKNTPVGPKGTGTGTHEMKGEEAGRVNDNNKNNDSDSDTESDYDSLNDWYTQQFSDILTLWSPSSASSSALSPYTFPSSASPAGEAGSRFSLSPSVYAPARPDSVLSLADFGAVGAGAGWGSMKPLPEVPAVLMPSPQLDPGFPRRKRTIVSGALSIPSPVASPSPSPSPTPRPKLVISPAPAPAQVAKAKATTKKGLYRPPPRISIPMDMGLGEDVWVDDDGDECECGEGGGDVASQRSISVYSQDSITENKTAPPVDLGEFDIDHRSRRPLSSLPTSPVDMESEFMAGGGLDQLARSLQVSTAQAQVQARVIRPTPSRLSLSMIPESEGQPAVSETSMDTPSSPTTSTSTVAVPSTTTILDDDELQSQQNLERVLRSRWSSSTLASLREKNERELGLGLGLGLGKKDKEPMSASSRLKHYFGGSKKGGSKRSSTSSSASLSLSSSANGSSPTNSERLSLSPISPFFPFPSAQAPWSSSSSPVNYAGSPSPSRKEFSPSAGSRSRSLSQRGRISTESKTSSATALGATTTTGTASPLRFSSSSPATTPSPSRKEFSIRRSGAGAGVLRRSASRSSTSTNGSSCASNSECGSCESSGSSGLRRKAIPVDLLIKC